MEHLQFHHSKEHKDTGRKDRKPYTIGKSGSLHLYSSYHLRILKKKKISTVSLTIFHKIL